MKIWEYGNMSKNKITSFSNLMTFNDLFRNFIGFNKINKLKINIIFNNYFFLFVLFFITLYFNKILELYNYIKFCKKNKIAMTMIIMIILNK
jgi:hypothetical protein